MSFKKISSYNQYHMFEMESHPERQYRKYEKDGVALIWDGEKAYFLLPLLGRP